MIPVKFLRPERALSLFFFGVGKNYVSAHSYLFFHDKLNNCTNATTCGMLSYCDHTICIMPYPMFDSS